VRLIELEQIGESGWERLIDGEPQPWGDVDEGLRWQPKTHTVGLLDDAGALIGTGGTLVTEVRAGQERFEVVGIGGIFITRNARGRGLGSLVIERLLQIAGELGPERAMLFCLPSRVALYSRFGFSELAGSVRATQATGPVTVPMRAMWRALVPGTGWPAGEVVVLGDPF
jgi:GNAT superfamily N-acetyltransferase